MTRDLARLTSPRFDLLVIGGGIYGTAAAWDATQRGLSVALIDRGDIGGGTSFNSAKTVHGGVRMLQTGRIGALRCFVRERRALSRIAPHLVEPLPFAVPTYGTFTRNRPLLRAYFALNDLLAGGRNDGLDPARRLPPSRALSRDECLTLNPVIDPRGVTGGIEWHDCQMSSSDRVTLAFLQTAVQTGAAAANYVEATGLRSRHGRACGITAVDRRTGTPLEIESRVVLNCAGPWAPMVLRRLAPSIAGTVPARFSLAMNIVTSRRLLGTHAVGGPAGGRLLFMAPWRGRTIIGTSHDPFEGDPDHLDPGPFVERLLQDVGEAFPRARLTPEDIGLLHRGLLPRADEGPGPAVRLRRASLVRDHARDGVPGLVSVLGVRYTTARDTAERAVDQVYRALDRSPPPCRTERTPLHGGEIADVRGLLDEATRAASGGLTASAARRLARTHGSAWRVLADRLRTEPDDARVLGQHCEITRAEIRHAVRSEMAVTLADAVLRRTEAGSGGHPGRDALAAAAEVIAEELGWSADRRAREVEDVEAVYGWAGATTPGV